MLILSGGTGTPKLIRGLKEILDSNQIKVVANTADDIWMTNNLVCPDLDTILYTLSGYIDDENWWGIKDDSYKVHGFLNRLGVNEYMKIGDKDRAIHLIRTKLLNNGYSLTEATEEIIELLEIDESVFPMTDDKVTTKIVTEDGESLHFQKWWIENSDKKIKDMSFEGIKKASPSEKFLKSLKDEENIIIGPSNPITSVYPIIGLGSVRENLRDKNVVAISPFLDREAFSGPATRLMRIFDYEPSSKGLMNLYNDIIDSLIVDINEKDPPKNSIKSNIIMKNKRDEISLSKFIIEEVLDES